MNRFCFRIDEESCYFEARFSLKPVPNLIA